MLHWLIVGAGARRIANAVAVLVISIAGGIAAATVVVLARDVPSRSAVAAVKRHPAATAATPAGDPAGLERCITDSVAGPPVVPRSDAAAQIDAIALWVERERGLRFRARPQPTFITRAELVRRRAADDAAAPANVAARAAAEQVLTDLGAITPGTDLAGLESELFEARVRGYYDEEQHQLVVVTDDASRGLDADAQATLAHELVHVLQDQNLERAPRSADDDARDAWDALVEGDATLAMYRFQHTGQPIGPHLDPRALRRATWDRTPARDRYPAALRATFDFPYVDGLAFACHLYAQGGWPAVDTAYARPPATTAQVVFPLRYAADEPAVAVRPPVSPPGWAPLHRSSVGVADLESSFAPAAPAPERLAAWAGGQATVLTRGGDTATVLALAERDDLTVPLCDSVREWYGATLPAARPGRGADGLTVFSGAGRTAALRCERGEVRLAIAPDLDTAAALTL